MIERKRSGGFVFTVCIQSGHLMNCFCQNDIRLTSGFEVMWLLMNDDRFSMVIDSGSTMTVIPNSIREKLHDPNVNWTQEPKYASGYADGEPIYQVSKPWYLRTGDVRLVQNK